MEGIATKDKFTGWLTSNPPPLYVLNNLIQITEQQYNYSFLTSRFQLSCFPKLLTLFSRNSFKVKTSPVLLIKTQYQGGWGEGFTTLFTRNYQSCNCKKIIKKASSSFSFFALFQCILRWVLWQKLVPDGEPLKYPTVGPYFHGEYSGKQIIERTFNQKNALTIFPTPLHGYSYASLWI